MEGIVFGAGRGDDQTARTPEELESTCLLQLAPELMRTRHERDENLALADRESSDPSHPMARATVVRRVEPIDSGRARAGLREMVQRGAADGPQADDGDVCDSFERGWHRWRDWLPRLEHNE